MKKTLIISAIVLLLIGGITLVFAVLGMGFGTTGDYTGDDNDGVPTKNLYCKAYVEGKWNLLGSDINIKQLECRTDEPFFIAENLAIFTVAEDVYCEGYLIDEAGRKVSTASRQSFGDLGVSDELWYKFGISKVPYGAYTVKVTCESATDPEDTASKEIAVNVS